MIFVVKLVVYFLLWTLWSYTMHVIAHINFKHNFIRYCHIKHHAYNYGDSRFPPWHDYFFWFGEWRSSMDVYMTFTIPLIVLTFVDPLYGGILLAFHYVYEVFLSRNVLDHNPNITGAITRFIPIGKFHLSHHRNVKCNFSFYTTLWDYLFHTNDARVLKKRHERQKQKQQQSLPDPASDGQLTDEHA